MNEHRVKSLMNLSLIVAIIGGGFMVYHFPEGNTSLGKIMNFGGLTFAAAMFLYSRFLNKNGQDDETDDENGEEQ